MRRTSARFYHLDATQEKTNANKSRNMAAIRSKYTKPEIVVRRLLWEMGIRYRLHRKDLPGKPDIVMPGRKIAIFVHGCFFHMHKCRYGKGSSSNEHPFLAHQKKRQCRSGSAEHTRVAQAWLEGRHTLGVLHQITCTTAPSSGRNLEMLKIPVSGITPLFPKFLPIVCRKSYCACMPYFQNGGPKAF
jgi:DNA mismatch endonuclease, patch repair protein